MSFNAEKSEESPISSARKHMDAVIVRIYTRSNDLINIAELLHKQGLKVIVNSNSNQGEKCEEIIVYREIDLEKHT